eukprot:1160758-Pelagomonas_calceolata.AAC.10
MNASNEAGMVFWAVLHTCQHVLHTIGILLRSRPPGLQGLKGHCQQVSPVNLAPESKKDADQENAC